jgi:pyruvate dehydrogenase E1 component alpha subunit
MQQQAALPLAEGSAPAPDVAVTLYRHMVRLRLVSARMVALQRSERIAFHTSCLGEEAAIVAATLAARDHDWIFPGAREWGAAIVRGLPIATYVHGSFGSAADPGKGHQSPDHPSARRLRVAPASGVVGAHVPQAVGLAWAAKIKKDDVVAVALFGEGATSTGDFHNAMNFAGVFKAPCVLVCRNNGRAASTPTTRQTKSESFAQKALAYGVASAKVDGSDPIAVLTLMQAAVARAAEGKGTTLVEVVTWPPAELPEGADALTLGDADPLVRLRAVLERDEHLDTAAHDALVRETNAELDAAIAAAEAAGPPAPKTIFEDVYAEVPRHLQEEASSWRR